jgi:hypothetical protein
MLLQNTVAENEATAQEALKFGRLIEATSLLVTSTNEENFR